LQYFGGLANRGLNFDRECTTPRNIRGIHWPAFILRLRR
jgi:hypothetical protein